MVSLTDIHQVSNVKQAPSPRPLIGGSCGHRCRWTSHHSSQYTPVPIPQEAHTISRSALLLSCVTGLSFPNPNPEVQCKRLFFGGGGGRAKGRQTATLRGVVGLFTWSARQQQPPHHPTHPKQ